MLKQRTLFTLLIGLSLLSPYLQAQDLHGPKGIIEILEKSKKTYQLLEKSDPEAGLEKGAMNTPYTYPKNENGELIIDTYEFEEGVRDIFMEAEKAFGENDNRRAIEYYKKTTELAPDASVAYTFMGQCYARIGEYEEAIQAYRDAIEINFHDYMAHWFMADLLIEQGKKEEAVDEITLAWVLNRNNPRILSSLESIYKKAKKKYQDFTFRPDYTVKEAGTEVFVEFAPDWMMYALCKAVWAHEPGYRQDMGGGDGHFNMVEEKESLLNLLVSYDNLHGKKKSKTTPEINYLRKALEEEYLDAYILFEIWLVQEPLIIYLQPKGAVEHVAAYIKEIRGEKL